MMYKFITINFVQQTVLDCWNEAELSDVQTGRRAVAGFGSVAADDQNCRFTSSRDLRLECG